MSLIVKDKSGDIRTMFDITSLVSQLNSNPGQDIVVTVDPPCPPCNTVMNQADFQNNSARRAVISSPQVEMVIPNTMFANRKSDNSTSSVYNTSTLFLLLIIVLLVLRLNKKI